MIIKYDDIDDTDMHEFGLACCPAHIRNGPESDYRDWLELNYWPDWRDHACEFTEDGPHVLHEPGDRPGRHASVTGLSAASSGTR